MHMAPVYADILSALCFKLCILANTIFSYLANIIFYSLKFVQKCMHACGDMKVLFSCVLLVLVALIIDAKPFDLWSDCSKFKVLLR